MKYKTLTERAECKTGYHTQPQPPMALAARIESNVANRSHGDDSVVTESVVHYCDFYV